MEGVVDEGLELREDRIIGATSVDRLVHVDVIQVVEFEIIEGSGIEWSGIEWLGIEGADGQPLIAREIEAYVGAMTNIGVEAEIEFRGVIPLELNIDANVSTDLQREGSLQSDRDWVQRANTRVGSCN